MGWANSDEILVCFQYQPLHVEIYSKAD